MKWTWHIVVLVGLAFGIRCAELHTSGKWARPLMLEPTEQVQIAQGLADGQGFITPFRRDGAYVHDPSAYSPPAYPFLLAGILKAGRCCHLEDKTSYRVALLVSVFAFSLAIGFLGWAGGEVGGRWGFWSVGLLSAIWPTLVTNSTALWDTPFTVLAICWSVYVAVMPRTSTPGLAWSLGAGLLSGIFMLFNPLVSPLCLVALAFRYLAGPQLNRRCVTAFALVLIAWTMCIAPWFVRNAVIFHRLIPVRNTFGFTLWVGNQPGVDGRATSTYPFQIGDNADERRKLWELGEDAYMRLKTEEAMAVIRADPSAFWKRTRQRFTLFWTGDLRNRTIVWGIPFPMIGGANILKAFFNMCFLLCAVGGTVLWGKQSGKWICWLGVLVMPLPYYYTHYSSNYRVFVDPILCLLAGIFFSRLLEKYESRNQALAATQRAPIENV